MYRVRSSPPDRPRGPRPGASLHLPVPTWPSGSRPPSSLSAPTLAALRPSPHRGQREGGASLLKPVTVPPYHSAEAKSVRQPTRPKAPPRDLPTHPSLSSELAPPGTRAFTPFTEHSRPSPLSLVPLRRPFSCSALWWTPAKPSAKPSRLRGTVRCPYHHPRTPHLSSPAQPSPSLIDLLASTAF